MFSTAKTLLRQRLYLLAKKYLLAENLHTEHGWSWRYCWHVAGMVQRLALVMGHEIRVEA